MFLIAQEHSTSSNCLIIEIFPLKFITPLNLNETAAVSKKPSFLHKILSETTEDTGKQASNG